MQRNPAFTRVPILSAFQRRFGGTTPTGPSGIVPFFRTNGGRVARASPFGANGNLDHVSRELKKAEKAAKKAARRALKNRT